MEKYVVRHYMSSRCYYNYKANNEYSTDIFYTTGILFRGTKADCIKYCKIQTLDAITKLICLDFNRIEYELDCERLYAFESGIHIMDYADENKKNFIFYHSNYYVEEYKTWMDD